MAKKKKDKETKPASKQEQNVPHNAENLHSEAENQPGENGQDQVEKETKNTDNQSFIETLPQSEEGKINLLIELKEELEKARMELTDRNDRLLRLQADFENFRKRKDREMDDFVRYANEDLLKKLLPVLDDFSRTREAIDKTDNLAAVKEGVSMVNRNLQNTLQKVGVEPIESVGQPFDPEFHEAITTVPVEEEEKKGMVIDEVEKGYKMHDRIIRYAKVIVGE